MEILAGPCSWETQEQVEKTVKFLVNDCGIKYIRGGLKKYRSNPKDFQGIGLFDGKEYLQDLKKEYGFKLVIEVFNADDLDCLKDFADVFQIGSRNAYNTDLLRETNRYDKPILYKRHYSMGLQEFVNHAGYMTNDVTMCLRGDLSLHLQEQRFRSDMADIQRLRELTENKICYDVSHSSCEARFVEQNTFAAMVYRPDMIMIETHPEPPKALSDSAQQLDFEQFRILVGKIRQGER